MYTKMLQSFATSILAIFGLFVIPAANGEPNFNSRYGEFMRRGHNSSELLLDSTLNALESAQEYLGKFGWVVPSYWTAISPRFNETIEEGETMALSETDINAANPDDSFSRDLSEEEFTDALRNFQLANGLDPSGELDDNTIRTMTKLRCGVPDLTIELNRSSSSSAVSEVENANSTTIINTTDSSDERDEASSGSAAPTSNNNTSQSRKRRSFHFGEIIASMVSPDDMDLERQMEIGEIHEIFQVGISEGELPHQSSRFESIEGVLAALRKEKMLQRSQETDKSFSDVTTQQTEVTAESTSAPSGLIEKIQQSAKKPEPKHRQKRSDVVQQMGRNGWGMAFAKRRITWRLVREWANQNNPLMTMNEIWFTVKLAFRMWSEVLPREFVEDNHSSPNEVDILIGFGEGTHNRCPVTFNSGPLLREYAHAWSLPKAEIHFNGIQPFVPVSWVPSEGSTGTNNVRNAPISLLKVATHEIGHALGLPHSDNRLSIMNPYYQPYQKKEIVELSRYDRESIRNIYGTCEISFDVVFDWVRQSRESNGKQTWKYNTYFFREYWYWLYENKVQRPRYGDPKVIAEYWRGVLQSSDPRQRLDGAVHVRTWRNPNGPTFFFKGDYYTEYDSTNDRAKLYDRFNRPYPRRIADDFPGVPHPIDTVFFNIREELLYFFKRNKVYRYSWKNGALLDSATISTAFPGWGGATPLPDNIDAAYYSYAFQAYYFFKGTYYWKLADARERRHNHGVEIPYNSVGPKQRISSKWHYICDVGASELVLRLPNS